MTISYEDLISGDSIFIEGVGHFKSPLLKDIKPSQGIGVNTYHFYLQCLLFDKAGIIDFITHFVDDKKIYDIINQEEFNVFDILTLFPYLTEIYSQTFSFFSDERIEYNEEMRSFLLYERNNEVGQITRDNFEEVCNAILQLNYIGLSENAKPSGYSSDKAKELWERAQKYLKEQPKNNKIDQRTSLGNIISKLSSVGIGYTLLNIYDLTIFQLYDQFFQYAYLRSTGLGERVYTNYGGDKFDIYGWLNPLKTK